MILLQYPLTTKPKISITTTASTSQTIQQLRKAISYLLSAFLGMLPYKHQAAIFPCSIHSYTEYKLTTQFSKSKNYFIFPSGERKYFNIWYLLVTTRAFISTVPSSLLAQLQVLLLLSNTVFKISTHIALFSIKPLTV